VIVASSFDPHDGRGPISLFFFWFFAEIFPFPFVVVLRPVSAIGRSSDPFPPSPSTKVVGYFLPPLLLFPCEADALLVCVSHPARRSLSLFFESRRPLFSSSKQYIAFPVASRCWTTFPFYARGVPCFVSSFVEGQDWVFPFFFVARFAPFPVV